MDFDVPTSHVSFESQVFTLLDDLIHTPLMKFCTMHVPGLLLLLLMLLLLLLITRSHADHVTVQDAAPERISSSCRPVSKILTRVTGQRAIFSNNEWTTPLVIDTVNMGSISAALQYLLTECIDRNTGYSRVTCRRKNDVKYIHFYHVTICNPPRMLRHFGTAFGKYVTMDEGRCNLDAGNVYCDYLHGTRGRAKLGAYVGRQDVSSNVRSPTPSAYWYSLPGACPLRKWYDKTAACKRAFPSGKCPGHRTLPTGEMDCTYNYELLGQIAIDDLVGMTSLVNPRTGRTFNSAVEFCRAGGVEFQRHARTFEFIRGLPFWKDPLDRNMNDARTQYMIKFYHQGKHNVPFVSLSSIRSEKEGFLSGAALL